MGEDAGAVFVHRNVGNQVLATDVSVMSTVQYAIDYLKIPHIIVCGHYDCGAVRAASTNRNHYAPLESWLTGIRDVSRMHRDELVKIDDPEARHRRLVELNVVESCLSLFKTPIIQKKRVETHDNPDYPWSMPRIHALVFDPAVGRLNRLDVDFNELTQQYGDIYDMYGENAA